MSSLETSPRCSRRWPSVRLRRRTWPAPRAVSRGFILHCCMHIDLAQHDHLVALRASGSSPQATGQLVWTRVPPTGHWLLGLILPVGRVQARGRGLADRARHVGVWSLVESPFPVTSRSALNSTVSLAFILSSSHSLSLALPVTTSFKPHINLSASLVEDSRPPPTPPAHSLPQNGSSRSPRHGGSLPFRQARL